MSMTKKTSLRTTISQILVKHNMPTRQAAISELVQLYKRPAGFQGFHHEDYEDL